MRGGPKATRVAATCDFTDQMDTDRAWADEPGAQTVATGGMSDAERFQTWQRDALAARGDDSEVLSVGPFRALLSTAKVKPPTGWITLIEGTATEAETAKALTKLRSAFKKRSVPLEIEYNEAAFPKVGGWLESAGLKLAERNQLMACRPEAFKPFTSEEVHITQLSALATPAELEAFQTIRWTDGGEVKRAVPPIDLLGAEMARPNSVYLLAWLEWEAVGTGVSHALKGAAEIVGVVTQKDKRRRGIAAAITSELMRRHFANGGEFVFLDAANADAARVYERLGFSHFGDNLVYR
jgi:ribosomal protein S18 acetylase RimI-like enzyme